VSYIVNFHPLAQADYDQIFDYIAERSPEGALSWDDALNGAVARLKSNPEGYSLIPDPVVTEQQYQQILFKTKQGNTYRAVFAIEGELVTVLRIRGQGQRLLNKQDLPNG